MLDNPDAVRALLREHGLFGPGERIEIEFLSGGVSSVVVKAESPTCSVVVKQALPQLKVRDQWLSRVERSLIEARCAAALTELVPGSVPAVLAIDEARHAFVMECAPPGSATWKSLLMAGDIAPQTAAAVGTLLGRIHARSATRPALAREFEDRSFFDELRLDPYLRTIATRHPRLAAPIGQMVDDLLATRVCLTHGDYSPKNLLVLPDGGIQLLDHEVAHWGNPAFDTAFVLNHLCLKALKFPDRAPAYLQCARVLWKSYMDEGPPGGRLLSRQTALVLGGLLLARVDGKSPVEYLESDQERERVRSLACSLIAEGVSDLDVVLDRVAGEAAHV